MKLDPEGLAWEINRIQWLQKTRLTNREKCLRKIEFINLPNEANEITSILWHLSSSVTMGIIPLGSEFSLAVSILISRFDIVTVASWRGFSAASIAYFFIHIGQNCSVKLILNQNLSDFYWFGKILVEVFNYFKCADNKQKFLALSRWRFKNKNSQGSWIHTNDFWLWKNARSSANKLEFNLRLIFLFLLVFFDTYNIKMFQPETCMQIPVTCPRISSTRLKGRASASLIKSEVFLKS